MISASTSRVMVVLGKIITFCEGPSLWLGRGSRHLVLPRAAKKKCEKTYQAFRGNDRIFYTNYNKVVVPIHRTAEQHGISLPILGAVAIQLLLEHLSAACIAWY